MLSLNPIAKSVRHSSWLHPTSEDCLHADHQSITLALIEAGTGLSSCNDSHTFQSVVGRVLYQPHKRRLEPWRLIDLIPLLFHTNTISHNMATVEAREATRLKDEELLAALGYKQEFKRAFSPLEVICYCLFKLRLLTVFSASSRYSVSHSPLLGCYHP